MLQESRRGVERGDHEDRRRTPCKFVVLNRHFHQDKRLPAEEVCVFEFAGAAFLFQFVSQFLFVSLVKIIMCYEIYFELEQVEEFALLFQKFFRGNGSVGDLF